MGMILLSCRGRMLLSWDFTEISRIIDVSECYISFQRFEPDSLIAGKLEVPQPRCIGSDNA
jgi:hypothetical protein